MRTSSSLGDWCGGCVPARWVEAAGTGGRGRGVAWGLVVLAEPLGAGAREVLTQLKQVESRERLEKESGRRGEGWRSEICNRSGRKIEPNRYSLLPLHVCEEQAF